MTFAWLRVAYQYECSEGHYSTSPDEPLERCTVPSCKGTLKQVGRRPRPANP